jgi:hypothetical protein
MLLKLQHGEELNYQMHFRLLVCQLPCQIEVSSSGGKHVYISDWPTTMRCLIRKKRDRLAKNDELISFI